MKVDISDDGETLLTPETHADKLALVYVKTHRPIFAVAEWPAIYAFIAGYEAAVENMNQNQTNQTKQNE